MTRSADAMISLTRHVNMRAKAADVYLDTYDADFHLSVIMEWLRNEGLALTGEGLRRIKR